MATAFVVSVPTARDASHQELTVPSTSSKHAGGAARSSRANNSRRDYEPSRVRNTLDSAVGKSTVDSRHDNGNPHGRHETDNPRASLRKQLFGHAPRAERSAAK